MMHISENGLNLIKLFEAFKPVVYPCAAGKPTIGYGHVVKDGESFTTLTEKEATQLLKSDCAIAENCVNKLVKVPLNQNQFDALVSFAFNVGCNAFFTSSLLKMLNKSDFIGAAEQFGRWIHANGVALPGLVTRRRKEKELFLGGKNA